MGKIVELTSENFAEHVLESDKPVFIDFWAPWCGPCKALAPVIDKLAESYAGRVIVAKLNIDDCKDIAEAHQVRGVPTVAIFESGTERHRLTGAQPPQYYRDILDSMLGDKPKAESDKALSAIDFAGCLMGKGTVDELRQLLESYPDFADTRVDVRGSKIRPMSVLLFRRDKERIEVLLEAVQELSDIELAGLGKVSELKDRISAKPNLVHETDDTGADALAIAALNGQLETARLLLNAGADPNFNAEGEENGTPVDAAITGGNVKLIELLIEHGGKVNDIGPNGFPVLHLAAFGGQTELVRCLIDNGIDPTVEDKRGRTVVEAARSADHEEIALFVENAIARGG